MANSQNGYPVLDSSETRTWYCPAVGKDRHLVLQSHDPGYLLVFLADWFHENVEPLDRGTWDEWGHAVRKVTGGSEFSNHASGTAVDLNATKHPYGKPNTFSESDQRKIWTFLRERMDDCIRWGGDYSSTKDDMHFEIVKGRDAVRRKAADLKQTERGKAIRKVNGL